MSYCHGNVQLGKFIIGLGSDIFYIFFMDETKEYFGFSSVIMVVIVVATSRVGMRFGETGNPPSI